MAKALGTILNVVGVVAGFVLAGPLGALVGFEISQGVKQATGLAKKASTVTSQTDRLTTTIDPRAYRKSVYGRTALANDLRYEEWFSDQIYCGWIVALASHKIESLDEIWINQDLAWSLSGGTTPKYQGYFYMQHAVLEGSPANTVIVSAPDAHIWNTSSRLTGCAYAHIQFRVTGTSKNATSPFNAGLPSRLTLIGRGGMMYDPRRDGTVPGGAGAMRAGDQSTWLYTAPDGTDLGSNIPLMILRELLGWKITNPSTGALKLAVGGGLPPRRIEMGSFIVAANIADELANRSAGGTEPKFHGGCVLSEGDDLHTRLDMLCAACNGRLREVNGKLALVIMHNDLGGAAADDGLNDDDVIGAFTWESDPPLDQCLNVVRGKFTDPSTTSLFQMIDYPEVRLDSPDGIDRIMPLDLSVAQSASHAQRVAKQVLERRQYQRTFSAPFDIRAWKYQLGDVVPFTFSPLSFDRRLLRVASQELGQDGTCVMSLMDENAAIYAWDADDAPAVQAAEPVVYDPTKSPLVLAIGEAATTADWPNVADPDGTRPEDNATVGATIGINLKKPDGTLASRLELINPALALAPDGRLLQTVDGTTTALGTLTLPDLGAASDSARRQLESDIAALSAAITQLSVGQSIVQNVFRDAGLAIDPATGFARLFAIEQTKDQVTTLSVSLNAALGTIGLKASVNYVDEAILAASLGGSTADLSPLLVRLTSAEADIDGLQATVLLKADATVVTGLQGVVSTVQSSIDAINATLTQKANQTVVDALGSRVTAAEDSLSAMDGASISQAVTAARYAPALSDAQGAAGIIALLAADQANQQSLVGLAQARQDLNARTDSLTSALASLTLQLGVQIGTVNASLATEQAARITGDGASATSLATYRASNDGAVGTLTTSVGTLTTNLSTLSASVTALSSTVGGLTGSVSTINATLATQGTTNTATASAITALQSSVGGLTTSLATVNTTLTTQASTNSTVAGQITTIGTTLAGHSSTLTTYGSSIDGLGAKVGVEINSDGVTTGWALNNSSGRTDIVFAVNRFTIAQVDGSSARTVFTIADDGTVQMPHIEVDTITKDGVDYEAVLINDFARSGAGSWTGSLTPTAGQTLAVPVNIDLGIVKPSGFFLAIVQATISTNAGQQEVGTYDGLPFYTHYRDDGGLKAGFSDAQSHRYEFGRAGTIAISNVATTSFDAALTASISAGAYDTGIVSQGDYYSRTISASYTLTSLTISPLRWSAF